MKRVVLADQTDFAGWRTAARSAVVAGTPPEEVVWGVEGEGGDLFGADEENTAVEPVDRAQFNVPKAFVALAREIIAHSHPERFALLYRLLWRLRATPQLLADVAIERAALPNLRRYYEARARRPAYAAHVLVSYDELRAA